MAVGPGHFFVIRYKLGQALSQGGDEIATEALNEIASKRPIGFEVVAGVVARVESEPSYFKISHIFRYSSSVISPRA